MNSQTITTRANSEHFGRDTSHLSSPQKEKGAVKAEVRQKKNNKAASAETQVAQSQSNGAAELAKHADNKETTFRLDAPSAHEVLLAGNFTEWAKTPIKMLKGGGGVWHTKVTLPPGRHFYRFVVDGAWQDDPTRNERVPNPYGTSDTVLEIA